MYLLTGSKHYSKCPKPLVTHQITAFHTKVSCEMPNCQNQPLNNTLL